MMLFVHHSLFPSSTASPGMVVPSTFWSLAPFFCYILFIRMSGAPVGLASAVGDTPTAELNAFWRQASQVVAQGDFDTYTCMYHPDAVLVQLSKKEEQSTGSSEPIVQALKRWKPGFDATREGKQQVHLAFRFRQRLHGPTTAHETGIFRYESSSTPESDTSSSHALVYMHFESLLVKKDGNWQWLMEYQKGSASVQDWNALEPMEASLE